MSAKSFLLEECANVRSLLDATLRNEYGLDGSRDFFEECGVRLAYISSELISSGDDDSKKLSILGQQLNELARLICRIERSSLGEYSWPFVEELKRIATEICTEPSLLGTTAKVYVLADGGLDAYRIFPEKKRPSASERLILTIVFPKTLKDFVLLHSILGHEIGHAIWARPRHQAFISANVLSKLKTSDGKFENPASTAQHLFSSVSPTKVQGAYAVLTARGINQTNIFSGIANWDAWVEEILCDLIGLVTFGPAFVAAQSELLYSLDPSGIGFGPSHPPVAWRVNLVLRGAKILGLDAMPEAGNALKSPMEKFWTEMHSLAESDPWYSVFSDQQISDALVELNSLLAGYTACSYPSADHGVMERLVSQLNSQVPPVGFSIDANGEPQISNVDFRHIIYAGWIASRNKLSDRFSVVNKLCQHAIMQQRAIQLFSEVAV